MILDILVVVLKPGVQAAAIRKALAGIAAMPPDLRNARAAAQKDRLRVYTGFHQRTQVLCAEAAHLAALAVGSPSGVRRSARTVLSLVDPQILAGARLDALRLTLHGAMPMIRAAVIADLVGDAQQRHASYAATARALESVAAFGSALGELRLIGRPGPQEHAEAVCVLLTELFSHVAKPDDEYRRCQTALGIKQTDYLRAARTDLARRWWHMGHRHRAHPWQAWRQQAPTSATTTAPDARTLLAELSRRASPGS